MKSEQKISDDDVPDSVKLEVAILSPPGHAPVPAPASRVGGHAGKAAFVRVIGADARCAFVAKCLAPVYSVDVLPDFAPGPSAEKSGAPAVIVCPPALFEAQAAGGAAAGDFAVLLIPEQEELDELVHRRALPRHVHILVWPFTEQVLRTRIRSLVSETRSRSEQ